MGLQFAYWAPNVSGGLVISKLPQKKGWSFEDNKRYAQIAQEVGFDYVLCFKTGLIGTAEQVADRIIELEKIGVDIVLTGFLHYEEELKAFGEKVIPLVKEKESNLKESIANI